MVVILSSYFVILSSYFVILNSYFVILNEVKNLSLKHRTPGKADPSLRSG